MRRVVADTNVLISALIFGGLPGSFFELALAGVFLLIASPALLDELDETLRIKFHLSRRDALETRMRLEASFLIVEPDEVLHVVTEDSDDDRILECAVAGDADTVVSGDRHLLRLGSYKGITILTVRHFMDSLA